MTSLEEIGTDQGNLPTTTNSAYNTGQPVNHMAVKTLPFSVKHPETWFRQMESQFHLARITSTLTKYHYVLAALPEEVVQDIPPDSEETYENIKSRVLDSLKGNRHTLIDQALSTVNLDGKRPTQIINEIKRRFADINITADDSIIKSRLLSALPPNIKASLVGHDDQPLDNYARIADSMMAVAGHNLYSLSAATCQSSEPDIAPTPRCSQMCGVENKNNYGNFGRNYHRDQKPNFNRSNKFTVRAFYDEQRPKICNAHIFYADRARTCRPWCKWPVKRQRMLRDHEVTPAQSRSSSPAKND